MLKNRDIFGCGLLSLLMIGAGFARAECPKLDGIYRPSGQWLRLETSDDKEISSLPPPFIDQYGFGYIVVQVLHPEIFQVTSVGSSVIVSVLKAEKILPNARNLEKYISLKCEGGGWTRSVEANGGGDNVPSSSYISIKISLDEEGNIISNGWRLTGVGGNNPGYRIDWKAKFFKLSVKTGQ